MVTLNWHFCGIIGRRFHFLRFLENAVLLRHCPWVVGQLYCLALGSRHLPGARPSPQKFSVRTALHAHGVHHIIFTFCRVVSTFTHGVERCRVSLSFRTTNDSRGFSRISAAITEFATDDGWSRGLPQRHPRRPPGVDTIATSTCTECRCPSRARSIDRRSSITTALRDLHWLPVKHRITFKVANLMHQALHRRCPAYSADLVAFSSTDSHRQLRSTTTSAAAIQRTRTQFSVCGLDVWNSLPPSVRTVDSNSSFHHALKTHLFQLAFNN